MFHHNREADRMSPALHKQISDLLYESEQTLPDFLKESAVEVATKIRDLPTMEQRSKMIRETFIQVCDAHSIPATERNLSQYNSLVNKTKTG